jgi:hypothetical protein
MIGGSGIALSPASAPNIRNGQESSAPKRPNVIPNALRAAVARPRKIALNIVASVSGSARTIHREICKRKTLSTCFYRNQGLHVSYQSCILSLSSRSETIVSRQQVMATMMRASEILEMLHDIRKNPDIENPFGDDQPLRGLGFQAARDLIAGVETEAATLEILRVFHRLRLKKGSKGADDMVSIVDMALMFNARERAREIA